MSNRMTLSLLFGIITLSGSGCSLIPDTVQQPQYHNPFPQLSSVAVLPFFNQSDEPTVDGVDVAIAYYNELKNVPGFQVVPVGATQTAAQNMKINPGNPADLRRLAKELGVDAVVVGVITEYTPYYPPRMGLAISWYAANPCFHPIPVGYGLPWGTCEEEYIPESLVNAAEFELAKAQLHTQTPTDPTTAAMPYTPGYGSPTGMRPYKPQPQMAITPDNSGAVGTGVKPPQKTAQAPEYAVKQVAAEGVPPSPAFPDQGSIGEGTPENLPREWPNPAGFIPPPPGPSRPTCVPYSGPIMTQDNVYNGADADFTAALENYYFFRDDGRGGGWQGYLSRSEDFTRFCCHMHITEMLTARGGAGKSRVVFRWPMTRYYQR